MAKRDDHIISTRFIAGLCWECEEPLKGEVHCGTLDDIRDQVVDGWTKPPLYCAEHCPLCNPREAAEAAGEAR